MRHQMQKAGLHAYPHEAKQKVAKFVEGMAEGNVGEATLNKMFETYMDSESELADLWGWRKNYGRTFFTFPGY